MRKELEFELGVRLKLLDLEKGVVSLLGPPWWSLSSPWLGLGGQQVQELASSWKPILSNLAGSAS